MNKISAEKRTIAKRQLGIIHLVSRMNLLNVVKNTDLFDFPPGCI